MAAPKKNSAPKKTIFWIMPFQNDFKKIYESFKKKLGRKYKIVCSEDNLNQVSLLEKIIPAIIDADFIIADVSTISKDKENGDKPLHNGNVMFELGIAMSYRKNVIMISASEPNEAPFDFNHYPINRYVYGFQEMGQFIKDIDEILKAPHRQFGNPVTDCDKKYELIPIDELKRLKQIERSSSQRKQVDNEQEQISETACLTSLSEYEKHLLRSALKNSKYEFETHSNNSGFSIKIRYIGELNKNGSCESSLNYESAIKQLVDKKFVDKTDEKRYGSVVIATYKVTKAGRDAIESFLTEVEKFRLKLTQKEYWTLYNIFQCIDISANEEEWKISLKSDLSNRGWIAPKPYISYEYRLFPYDRDSFLLLRKLLFSITQRGWATESQGLQEDANETEKLEFTISHSFIKDAFCVLGE